MDYLILVDKFNPVPQDFYKSMELVNIRGKLAEKQTGQQLEKMLLAAEKEDVDIKIISAYRTEEYQKMLWEKSVSEEVRKGQSYCDAVETVSKTLALPGSSEHNTGLAVDFGTTQSDDVEDDFFRTTQAKWLCRNAADYGFILRYPRMKEHITGISYEPWHYRYVGTQAAKIIKSGGICLEEFLHFYADKYLINTSSNCKNN